MTGFWDAMALAGPYANNLDLAPDRQPQKHLITQFFTGWMLFLTENQRCESTEGKKVDDNAINTHSSGCRSSMAAALCRVCRRWNRSAMRRDGIHSETITAAGRIQRLLNTWMWKTTNHWTTDNDDMLHKLPYCKIQTMWSESLMLKNSSILSQGHYREIWDVDMNNIRPTNYEWLEMKGTTHTVAKKNNCSASVNQS